MAVSTSLIASYIKRCFRRDSPAWASRMSLLLCIVMALIGIVVGALEDALAIKTNGIIAAIDVLNSILFLGAVERSIRQADYIYNYGYGKYESLAMLLSAVLLILTSMFVVFEVISSLGEPVTSYNVFLLGGVSIFSFFAMRIMAKIQKRYAVKHRLSVLFYDADLWRIDSVTELCVALNVVGVNVALFFGLVELARIMDSLAALVLLAIALRAPLTHGRDALTQLLDKTLPEEVQLNLLAVISTNFSSFCEFRAVHTRQAGKDLFVEIDLVMPFDYTVEKSYETEQTICEGIKARYPNAITRIYSIPCPRDCIKNGRRFCPVHDVSDKE